jgi:hypothetical protein
MPSLYLRRGTGVEQEPGCPNQANGGAVLQLLLHKADVDRLHVVGLAVQTLLEVVPRLRTHCVVIVVQAVRVSWNKGSP